MSNGLSPKSGFSKLLLLVMTLCAIFVICVTIYGRSTVYTDKHKAAEFCNSCHEMQADYNTWMYSSHSEELCTRCHSNVSPTSIALNYLTNSYVTPVKLKDFYSDANCLQCHNPNRVVTPPGDLIVPHDLHTAKGVDCIDCHNNIAHGDIYRSKLIGEKMKPQDVTKTIAQEQLANNNQVKMSTCMRCHNGAKAPDACSACHKVLRQPTK